MNAKEINSIDLTKVTIRIMNFGRKEKVEFIKFLDNNEIAIRKRSGKGIRVPINNVHREGKDLLIHD